MSIRKSTIESEFRKSNLTRVKPSFSSLEIHNELDRFKRENLFYDLKDLIDITIEYLPKGQTAQHPLALLDDSPSIQSSAKRRFLRVECSMKISHLKKWIKLKFGLPYNQRVVLLFENEILPDSYQMIDLAYIFSRAVSATFSPNSCYVRV